MSDAYDTFGNPHLRNAKEWSAERIKERDRQLAELRAKSPLRSTKSQDDAGHLPLFVAANEPGLL